MKELIEKVIEWGEVRGMHKYSNSFAQLSKLNEEFLEYVTHVAQVSFLPKDEFDALIKDDIGDMIVCLINSYSFGLSSKAIDGYLKYAEDVDKRGKKLIEGMGCCILHSFARSLDIWGKEIEDYIQTLCNVHGLTMEECLEAAYEEIKDRQGEFREDGKFYKSH